MILNQLKSAFRSLFSNKIFSAINIFGLSVGMTAAVFIFWWVRNELSYDSFHKDADRIVRVTSKLTDIKWVWETAPLPLADAAKETIPEIELTAQLSTNRFFLTFNINEKYFTEDDRAFVDKNWFTMFHYEFVKGNAYGFTQDPYSMIITESKARKYFGSDDPMGKIIKLDTINYTVRGVIKDNPSNSSFQFDVIMPIEGYLKNPSQMKNDNSWNNFNYLSFFKIQKGADFAKVEKKFDQLLKDRKQAKDVAISLIALKDIHFEKDLTSDSIVNHGDENVVYIFSVLGIVLLFIACVNYVNLTTAKASMRAKEVSIRKIVGARKWDLFFQFILESFVVSLISLLIAVLLIWLLLPLFNNLTERNFIFSLSSSSLWLILGLTVLSAIILNGIYPAILLSSFQPLKVFKGVTILKFKDVSVRKGLVVAQFSFSVILIAATIIFLQQIKYIQEKNVGYDRSQLFAFSIPWKHFSKYDKEARVSIYNGIKQELVSQTSIAGVTRASGSIVDLTSSNSGSADWDGHDTTFSPTVFQLAADNDYRDVFKLEMKEGRWFDKSHPMDEHNFILNETAVNEFNIRKPVIGQRFTFQGDTGKIIGVVKDFHFRSLHTKIAPLAILNRGSWGGANFYIKTNPGKTTEALAAAGAIWRKYAPYDPFDYTFLDESFDKLYSEDRKISTLSVAFAIIAVLISSLGLFGLATFAAERRIKEIGIRKVLGASVGNILVLLSADFIKLVIIAIVISSPIAWWLMSKWLEDFAYRINLSWWMFALGGLLSILIAIVTMSFQTLKAANANPSRSLKTE